MNFSGTHTCLCRLQKCPSADFGVFKSETRLKTECETRVLLRHALPTSLLILRKKPIVLQSNMAGALFGRCSLGRNLLVILSLLFMQLSEIQYGVWLFSGEMTLLQRLKNLPSFWAFRSLLSVKEGNLFSSIESTFSFFGLKNSVADITRCRQ